MGVLHVRVLQILVTSTLFSLSNTRRIIKTAFQTNYEVITVSGLDQKSLDFLKHSTDRVEILVQWIQRLTVDNMSTGVLPIPPPVIVSTFGIDLLEIDAHFDLHLGHYMAIFVKTSSDNSK